mgnify:CR=1 FL=1
MGTMTETQTLCAAKQHRCTWCWQLIAKGETYMRYRFFNGGDAGTCKMHPECYEAMEQAAQEEGGWFEWAPGMERPAPYNKAHRPAEGGSGGAQS